MPEILPPPRHETRDVTFRGLVVWAGVVVGTALLMATISYLLYPTSPLNNWFNGPIPDFPQPRLEPSPRADLHAFFEEEMRQLNSAGWIDKQKGIVHIPIDQAMRLVAQRGISGWPGSQPAGAAAGAGRAAAASAPLPAPFGSPPPFPGTAPGITAPGPTQGAAVATPPLPAPFAAPPAPPVAALAGPETPAMPAGAATPLPAPFANPPGPDAGAVPAPGAPAGAPDTPPMAAPFGSAPALAPVVGPEDGAASAPPPPAAPPFATPPAPVPAEPAKGASP